jgi:hypothetical protein
MNVQSGHDFRLGMQVMLRHRTDNGWSANAATSR